MLQTILLVVMMLIGIALTGVVLLQRSEGGALGMGGGPSGFMTARGAGNLLSLVTWWLAGAFFVCAISLTIVGNIARGNQSIIDKDAVGSIAVGNEAPATAPTTAPAQPAAPTLQDLEASVVTAPTQTAPQQEDEEGGPPRRHTRNNRLQRARRSQDRAALVFVFNS